MNMDVHHWPLVELSFKNKELQHLQEAESHERMKRSESDTSQQQKHDGHTHTHTHTHTELTQKQHCEYHKEIKQDAGTDQAHQDLQ